MEEVAIVSFEGEMSCFIRALLNLWNCHEKGLYSAPFRYWQDPPDRLVRSICKACAIRAYRIILF